MHNERFRKLEGSWRGLKYLVQNSETGTGMKLRLLQASKKELSRDLQRATEFDPQLSVAWKLLGKAHAELGNRPEAEAAWQQGMQVAEANGDAQTVKEITVFLKRLHKTAG